MATTCSAFGLVSGTKIVELANLLRGLCQQYGPLEVHEVGLTMPMQEGTSSTALRLSRRLNKEEGAAAKANPFLSKQPQAERWLVQHEGLPMRGANVASLPAAVREVYEAYGHDSCTPEFFMALGAQHDYALVKRGNEYHCVHDGHSLRVQVLQVTPVPAGCKNPSAVQMASKYMLNMSTQAAEGQYAEASNALGSFAKRLAPLVVVQPACHPFGSQS